MDTSGFYRVISGEMIYAPNAVQGPNSFFIERAKKDEYQYPIDGWTWYDSKEEAYQANGLQIPEQTTEQNNLKPNTRSGMMK